MAAKHGSVDDYHAGEALLLNETLMLESPDRRSALAPLMANQSNREATLMAERSTLGQARRSDSTIQNEWHEMRDTVKAETDHRVAAHAQSGNNHSNSSDNSGRRAGAAERQIMHEVGQRRQPQENGATAMDGSSLLEKNPTSDSIIHASGRTSKEPREMSVALRRMREVDGRPSANSQAGGGSLFSVVTFLASGAVGLSDFYNAYHGGVIRSYISDPEYMLIVDARTRAAFEAGHVRGAVLCEAGNSSAIDVGVYNFVIVYDDRGLAAGPGAALRDRLCAEGWDTVVGGASDRPVRSILPCYLFFTVLHIRHHLGSSQWRHSAGGCPLSLYGDDRHESRFRSNPAISLGDPPGTTVPGQLRARVQRRGKGPNEGVGRVADHDRPLERRETSTQANLTHKKCFLSGRGSAETHTYCQRD